MRRCAIALLAVAVSACRGANPAAPPVNGAGEAGAIADLSRRVRERAGMTLRECGMWLGTDRPVPAEALTRAIECGRAAVARREPFWIAMHAPGGVSFHEVHAQGLFAGTDGVIHRFTYAADVRMAGGPGPEFAVVRCDEPAMAASTNAFRCSGEQAP